MTMETTCPLCGRRTIDPLPVSERLRCVECDALVKAAPKLLTACRNLLEICRWKCSPTDEVLLSDGTSNEQAMIEAMAAIADADGRESAPFPLFSGTRDK